MVHLTKDEDRTVIFYESPYRIAKTLDVMQAVYGDIPVVVARELTKKFEEVVRGRLPEVAKAFSNKKNLGEFVVLFNLVFQEKQP